MASPSKTGKSAVRENDPRRVRSRARLIEAASRLLASGGAGAVTVDAVTKTAKVARATLYRHFDGAGGLVVAAFEKLLPEEPVELADAHPREQLVDLLMQQAEASRKIPIHIEALCWLGLAIDIGDRPRDSDKEIKTLRQRLVAQHRIVFDNILTSEAAVQEIGEVDLDAALAQLAGPFAFALIASLKPYTADDIRRVVNDFWEGRAAEHKEANA